MLAIFPALGTLAIFTESSLEASVPVVIAPSTQRFYHNSVEALTCEPISSLMENQCQLCTNPVFHNAVTIAGLPFNACSSQYVRVARPNL
jgi:hypothetical protein